MGRLKNILILQLSKWTKIRKVIRASLKFDSFNQQLSIYLEKGLPLPEALRLASSDESGRRFKELINRVAGDISEGLSFSETLTKYKRGFPYFYRKIVELGEKTGRLPKCYSFRSIYVSNNFDYCQYFYINCCFTCFR